MLASSLMAMLVLFFTGDNKDKRQLDERITFRAKDKIPYGTYVAYENLDHIFPDATIVTSKQEPGYWDSLSNYDSRPGS